MSKLLKTWPSVNVDEGLFKYVLIKIMEKSSDHESRLIVRGYTWATFHNDVYRSEQDKLSRQGLLSECIGGGRIQHDPRKKQVKVYGYSNAFGRADHSLTVEILKTHFSGDYKIEWSNDGY